MPSPRLTLVGPKPTSLSVLPEVKRYSCKAINRPTIAPFLAPSVQYHGSHWHSRRRQLHTYAGRPSQRPLPCCTFNVSVSSSSSSSNTFHSVGKSGLVRSANRYSLHQQQRRDASILSSLSDNPAAYNKKIRRGRGASSGKGKTSGRGHKGTKARGKVRPGFEGGQTPIAIVKGKRGFINRWSPDIVPLNVDRLQEWIDQGRLDTSKPITIKELHESRCLHGVKDGVKLLGANAEQLRTPVKIIVSQASQTAIKAIEAAGGTIMTRYYSPSTINLVLRGLVDPINSNMMRDAMKQMEEQDQEKEAENNPQMKEQSADSSSPSDSSEPAQPIEPVRSKMPAMMEIKPDLSFMNVFKTHVFGSGPEETSSDKSTSYRFRLADPTSRRDFEYYRDHRHRGYLSPMVRYGESPSLFHRVPGSPLWQKAKKKGPKDKQQGRLF